MKSIPRWFLIPPAAAALLILGSLAMQGSGKPGKDGASATAAEPTAAPTAAERKQPQLPRTPDLTQMASALVGVLLLGVGGVVLLRRLRQPARAPRGAALFALRQSLRLSPKQTIHALEFDDRLLLIGETERGLALLDTGKLPERDADEAAVLARPHAAPSTTAEDDDGAVPKDLVIPRPAAPARRLPTPPSSPAEREPQRASAGLADFRNLLQKVGRS